MLSTETHERIGLGKLVKIDKSGRKLNYWCEGDPKKKLILCLHGAFDNMLRFYEVMMDLSKDYRVCAWDRAGRGFSDPSEDADRAELALSDMAHLIEHLGKANEANVTRYVLLAHSLGGLLSVAHAQRINNDVTQSIILMDPPPIVRDIQSTAIFKKLEFVWNLSFPLFGFFSITGLFRLTTAIIGSNGYWFDTLSANPRVRLLQARNVNCATYFRAAARDTVKACDMTTLVHSQHDKRVATMADHRLDQTSLYRITSDYVDMHDVLWANLTRAEIRAFLHDMDNLDNLWFEIVEPKKQTHIHFPNSTHVFVSMQAADTIQAVRRFLVEEKY